MVKRDNDDTFMRITNKDIYDMLKEIKNKNSTEHEIINQHLIHTNGKVRLNRWIATTALSFVLIAIGIIAQHIGK